MLFFFFKKTVVELEARKILEKNSRKLSARNIGSGWNTSGQKGGKICFGVTRLQTLRNSVSSNFIHSSHWIDGDTTGIDADNRDTQCRRGVPSIRVSPTRKRNTEFEGEEGGRRKKDKPLGFARCTNVSSSSRDSETFTSSMLARCSFLGSSLEAAMISSTQSRSRLISREGRRDGRIANSPREIIALWKRRNLSILYLYIIDMWCRALENGTRVLLSSVFPSLRRRIQDKIKWSTWIFESSCDGNKIFSLKVSNSTFLNPSVILFDKQLLRHYCPVFSFFLFY